MQLVLISYPKKYPDEHQILTSMFEKGLETFHIRKPKMEGDRIRKFIRKIPSEFHNRLVLHQAHQLCGEFDVKGLHFKSDRLPKRQEGLRIGWSVHNIDSKTKWYDIDYTLISPVFESISKPGYGPTSDFDLDLVPDGVEPIALGGLNPDRVQIARQKGYKGVAFLGYVWKAKDPLKQFKLAQEVCRQPAHIA